MEANKLSIEDRIKYVKLFQKVAKALIDGGTISKEDAIEALDIISMLIDNPAFTKLEQDKLADLGIMLHQIEDDS